jgi:hypothetical protein
MNISRRNMSVAALIIVLFGAGVYFLSGKGGGEVTTTETLPGSTSEVTFLGLASELDTVSFNNAIFTDQRFLVLQDIHTGVIPEQVGRTDPFAPLAGVASK